MNVKRPKGRKRKKEKKMVLSPNTKKRVEWSREIAKVEVKELTRHNVRSVPSK